MLISTVTQAAGAHKRRKRLGRGESSGKGKTSGKGHKGCQSRSGGGTRALTEGGQMPIFRRLPKRGFSNFNFRTEYEVVNLGDLERRFEDGDTVDIEVLRKSRLVAGKDPLVKILAKGKLTKKLTVEAHAVSEAARKAVESAGGALKLIERVDPAAAWRQKRNSAKSGNRPTRVPRLEKKKSTGAAE